MKNILLFADPGIDDSIAIMYALLHPDIHLIGIVSGYGNVDKSQATDNVAYLLHLANKENIPIIGGATRSCTGEFPLYYPEIHGKDGLGPLRPPDTIKGELLNFSEIFQLVEKYEDIVVVDVGRNTSLAVAFILDDKFADKIKDFYIMGGAFLVPGNVSKVAEANFFGDPVSSHFVMSIVKNVTCVPLNVTNQALITKKQILEIQKASSNPLVKILDKVYDYYFEAYQKLVPGIKGAPLHDVLSLSLVMNPNLGSYLIRDVVVSNLGEARGESIADFRVGSENNHSTTKIYMSLDYPAFIEDFVRIMSK
ncbi:nucleoside hydrolase [Bacillus sp. BHET2]|uniref:nucleoside hydrolase n=1 Tax=Bacillus sp. BHET2 TaxID=2583818 RepID=UPI00110E5D1E|nr:nucleoside hydrolase [Bacillus sp. BHET2]TMU88035.1 nucleoside hydrolase [Bacillus sp. BHET2]